MAVVAVGPLSLLLRPLLLLLPLLLPLSFVLPVAALLLLHQLLLSLVLPPSSLPLPLSLSFVAPFVPCTHHIFFSPHLLSL